ncbi:probable cytochrome P450 304a1 [Bradysia coprophila]|uniref:probable cytochrome P450 304a1 n=1 Tax=Bradysia coprophila TaxID=38358 RepID=UPI00187DD62E|nr:probable cytochrome P450 304a1 [Bradysia coprophila]
MASVVLFAVCFGLIVYKAYKYMFFKPPNFPPGPPRLPFIGAYLFLLIINYKHLQFAVDKLCKFYKTNVLGLYLGPFLTVVANDSASIKETTLNEKLDGRPDVLLSQVRDPNLVSRGITFTQGFHWRDERRFTLRHLRDFGFGRRFSELELELEEELRQLIEIIKNGPKYPHEREMFKDGMVLCPNVFFTLASNSFLKVLCNERVPRENHDELLRVIKHTDQCMKDADSYGKMFSLMPWIAKIFPNQSDYNKIKKATIAQYDFMKKLIDEQYESYDENHVRHFLDVYFKEMKATQRSRNYQHADFHYDQLILTCLDFFNPATISTTMVLSLYLRELLLNPQIKEKIQVEIDQIVGRSRLPALDDRSKMHYTEASIREILRYQTLAPNGVPRVALESTQLSQYDIPKGCTIFTGLRSGHLDSSRWDDPNQFVPERFLDTEGKLDLSKDHSLPFGGGKRLCAGETHGRNLLFLVITAILQNFDISVPDVSKLPRETDFHTGVITFVPEYFIKFDARK